MRPRRWILLALVAAWLSGAARADMEKARPRDAASSAITLGVADAMSTSGISQARADPNAPKVKPSPSPPPASLGIDARLFDLHTVGARLRETFDRGGSIMYALLLLSMGGFTFALERLVALRRERHLPGGLLETIEARMADEGADAAARSLTGNRAALARVLQGLLLRIDGADREALERALADELDRVHWDERRNIRPIGVVASAAPLFGLLGTVMGMIGAFHRAATQGMDDPAHFAEGIHEALYTTAFGLMIAIPALLCHHYLRARADGLLREVEDAALRFVIRWNARQRESGGAEKASPTPSFLLARRQGDPANAPSSP